MILRGPEVELGLLFEVCKTGRGLEAGTAVAAIQPACQGRNGIGKAIQSPKIVFKRSGIYTQNDTSRFGYFFLFSLAQSISNDINVKPTIGFKSACSIPLSSKY